MQGHNSIYSSIQQLIWEKCTSKVDCQPKYAVDRIINRKKNREILHHKGEAQNLQKNKNKNN